MANIRVGNAPVSWGIYGAKDAHLPFARVLDAIAEAGYEGTELGPYGYLPTDPAKLKVELDKRKLGLGSSYLGIPLEDPSRRAEAVESALEVGKLLAAFKVEEVICADDDAPERQAIAGRVPKDGSASWSAAAWKEAAETLHAVARALRDRLGLRVVVHHHVGTFIETPEEIDRLLAHTDPDLVNLLLDTGHATYGGGDARKLLQQHGKRIRYLHLKDVSPTELAYVKSSKAGTKEAWTRGIFSPLGKGMVDFPGIAEDLRKMAYRGWAIVEQDVMPDAQGKMNPDPFDCARQSRRYLKQECGL